MPSPFPRSRPALLLATASLLASATTVAQQPQLWLTPHGVSRLNANASLGWSLVSRPGDVYVLLADSAPGNTTVLGRSFDLAFSPGLLALAVGVFGQGLVNGNLALQPPSLPAGVPLYLQFASWAPQLGFDSLLVSNVDSFAAHSTPVAFAFSFENIAAWAEPMTGLYDQGQQFRLQALPPTTRVVRPLPPQAWPLPAAYAWQPLHPSGARFQLALRAADLGATGSPERLTAVRWRPLFGVVADETFPQFELLAAHSDVVPDYRLDPITNLPIAPASGLAPQFAANPSAGTTPVTMFSGTYDIQAQDLLPSGYLPFPAPQQAFDYDGTSSLLLETRCPPRPGLGTPQNFQLPYRTLTAVTQPASMVFAAAGWNGQPSPLPPLAATTGTGDALLYDWELEFERTVSVAQSAWFATLLPNAIFLPAIAAQHTPPGTSLVVEFRAKASATATPGPWSSSPGVGNGLAFLQFRVTMTANATTGAVPWLDTLLLPVL